MTKYGASWEDVVIRFEWRRDLEAVKNSSQQPMQAVLLIRQMLESHPELEYCFDPLNVVEIAKSMADEEALT